MKRAVCPGSFDPITYGHLDIIERAAQQFDHVVVAVLENRTKSSLFTVTERIAMIQEVTTKFPNVSVDSWSGLLVDYCKSNAIQAIVKGLRAVTDFDYELQMAQVNLQGSGVETMFMATSPAHSFLSSSLVKELAHYNGDVSTMVPPSVNEALKARVAGKQIMDSVEKLTSAITLVEEARGVPLSASCVVHRAEMLEILDDAREALPTDFESARKILETRDAIIEEARVSAEQLISIAREDVAQMVEQTSIVQIARDEARKILDDARETADLEKQEVEEYIDGRLATLEVILNKTMDAVSRGRDRLAGANDKDVLSQLADE